MSELNKKDIKIETMRGKGPGGQHKNKTDSCVRVTHIPTGISVTIDGRSQHKNKALALRELERRLKESEQDEIAKKKKARRDKKIKEHKHIRTYDYTSNRVTDHRTKVKADLKKVLNGGLDLLYESRQSG
jgi:peptide chain release factor 1